MEGLNGALEKWYSSKVLPSTEELSSVNKLWHSSQLFSHIGIHHWHLLMQNAANVTDINSE